MTTGEKIKMLRLRKGMSQEELGKKVGVQKAAINKYEKGIVVNLKMSTIAKLADALDVTPVYLMGIDDEQLPSNAISLSNIIPMPNFVRKPRLGTIACGKPILAVEEADQFDMVPENIQCDFTLKCKGDSMINARIYDGDIVYIRSQKEVENGEIAAVRVDDEATLKRVYYNGQRIILRACNPLYQDMEFEGEALNNIQVLGKAIAFTSMVQNNL